MRIRHLLIAIAALVMSIAIYPATTQAAPAQAANFTVYITFDDGPYGGRTDRILDILKKYNVKATFFVEGGHIARGFYSEIQRIVSEGHHLGNHLWLELRDIMFGSRPAADKLQSQYNMTQDIIHKALGDSLWAVYQQQPPLFRWPGGSPFVMPGMPNLYNYNWNVSSGDDVVGATVGRVVNNALFGYPPDHYYGVYAWGDGAILMFHDPARVNVYALPKILQNLQAHGVQFGLLPRPGDKPGVVIGTLGGVPPCANQAGNCGAENEVGFLPG